MPNAGEGLFLELLKASHLVGDEQLSQWLSAEKRDPATLAAQLVQDGWITGWQLRVLQSGATGPFQLGDFLLLDRLEVQPLAGCFAARHRPSGHPVLLAFHEDSAGFPPLPAGWDEIRERADLLATVRSPHLLEVFRAFSLPDYAFVASEFPTGKTLAQLLAFRRDPLPSGGAAAPEIPPGEGKPGDPFRTPDRPVKKAKLPQVMLVGSQIGAALAAIHAAGADHGCLDLDQVWMVARDSSRLHLPIVRSPSHKPDYLDAAGGAGPLADVFGLGWLLFRMLTGEAPPRTGESGPVDPDQAAILLAAEKAHDSMVGLLLKMLAAEPSARPTADSVARKLVRATGSEKADPAERPASYLKLRESLAKAAAGSGAADLAAETAGIQPLGSAAGISGSTPAGILVSSSATVTRSRRRRSPAPMILSALATAALATIGLILWFNRTGDSAAQNASVDAGTAGSSADAGPTTVGLGPEGEKPEGEGTPAPDRPQNGGVASQGTGAPPVLVQNVVADDGKRLWESPTTGPMLDLTGLPPAPRMVFSVRCAELIASEEGSRLIRAGGADLENSVAWFQSATGLELSGIRQLLIGVYNSEDPLRYQYFYVARLKTPAGLAELQSTLGLQPAVANPPDESAGPPDPAGGERRFRKGGMEVYAMPPSATAVAEGEAAEPPAPMVDSLLFGPAELVDQAAATRSQVAADGAFARLAPLCDNQRLVQALVIPAALFNDPGQEFVGQTWSPLNNRLRVLLNPTLRTVAIGLHLDSDCYLELILENSVDTRPAEALTELESLLAQLLDEANGALAQLAAHPWWARVRQRSDNMLLAAWRNMRTGIENDLVIANCWLPLPAPHNLLATGEIAFTSTGGKPIAAATPATPSGPRSLDDLLKLPRDLEVTTSPDLGLLLEGLETEINDQYRNLPFRFRIRMEGNDLLKQGITQNQRPGSFSLKQVPLAGILTEIMFRANSNKTATGPSDPLCELVWLVSDDPDQPGQKLVLVTTRTAAGERNLTLPPQFVGPDSAEEKKQ